MSWIDGLRERLRPLTDRHRLEAELDEELRFHFDREVATNLAAGMTPRQARRAARASMGGALSPAEGARSEWRGLELGGLGHELKIGVRRLRRRPGFAVVAALTLAIGIGANTAIFSLVRNVLIQPLPYLEPDRLALIWNPDRDRETWLSVREILEYRAASRTFQALAGYTDFEVALTQDAEPERVPAAAVTGNAFAVLGAQTLHGRFFTPEEDLPSASGTALLSHELWQRRYGGDPSVVGRTITANGQSMQVIGVLQPGFRLPLDYWLERPTQIFVPAQIDETANLSWGNRGWFAYGRLAPDATHASATADIRAVTARWIQEGMVPANQMDTERDARPLDEVLLAEVRAPLFILMGAVGFILLIACANVTHLLLARSEGRRTEVAVAAAMGASPLRLARLHLIENGLLAALGGLLGLGLALIGLRAAQGFAPLALIRLRGVDLDATVLGLTALLTLGTTLLAGLGPALKLGRVPLTSVLGATRGATGGTLGARMRRGLLATESGLAVVLVIGAALLARSFAELSRLDLGFDPSNVLTAGITLPPADYPEEERVGTFFRDLRDRLGQLPGVEAAGAGRVIPLAGSIGTWTITLEEPLPDPEEQVEPNWQIVTPGYAEAMGLELREGRFLTDEDRAGGRLVGLISVGMADRYWPGESPLGRRFHVGTLDQPWVAIVGVVGTVRHNDLLEEPRIEMYLPHEQWPEIQGNGSARRTMNLVVRTAGDPMDALPAVRRELRALDANVPLADPQAMSAVAANALAEQRFTAGLLGVFAVLALSLAAVGLYGVTSYATSRRAGELGVRLALGARKLDVAGLVLREALGVAGLGVVAGGLAAAWMTRFIAGQLYGVSPLDPATFVAVPLFLLLVAGLAAYLPARRAASIDPVLALRSEG